MDISDEILNKILSGEHMAIDQYQAYVDALPASPLRNHLVAILTDHKKHATRLSYFIQTNGGHAIEGSGVVGQIAKWKTRAKHLWENEPLNMLDELFDGESKGLQKAKDLSENTLSGSEKEILASIFSDEEGHLQQLQDLKKDLLQ